MELRRRIKTLTVALLLSIVLLSTFMTTQVPVAQGGLWCGQSCTSGIVPPTPPAR